MRPDADSFMTADVLASDTTDGEIRCKLGEVATGQGKSVEVPMFCSSGFIGVPNEPDAQGSAAQACYMQDGDEQKIIGVRDNRLTEKVGVLSEGDCAIVSLCDAAMLLKKQSNTIAMISKNPDGKTMIAVLDGEHGVAQIMNGGAFIEVRDDEIILAVNGGGRIRVSKTGVQITGGSFQATTGTVQLGAMPDGKTPPPPSPISMVAIGPQPGAMSTKVYAAP